MGFVKEKEDEVVNMLNDMESMLTRRLPLNKDEALIEEFKQIAKEYGYKFV